MQLESPVIAAPVGSATGLSPDLCRTASMVLCDLDGCLVAEGRAFPDAADFVSACGDRLWIVSNNSADTARGLSSRLAGLGLSVPARRILLAGEQTLRHLARSRPGARLSLYASPALSAVARTAGFDEGGGPAEIALLCRDAGLTVETIGRLVTDIERGAMLWVSNTDIAHPGLNGQPIAETGVLLAAVEAMRPGLAYGCIGKPDPFLLSLALRAGGVAPERTVFVGDNLDTDGDAARAAGVPFIHLVRRGGAA